LWPAVFWKFFGPQGRAAAGKYKSFLFHHRAIAGILTPFPPRAEDELFCTTYGVLWKTMLHKAMPFCGHLPWARTGHLIKQPHASSPQAMTRLPVAADASRGSLPRIPGD
jgi:hypothetical protein